MKRKALYVAALMLLSSSFCMAKKKVEYPEITKLKAKIENVMQKVDAQPDWRTRQTLWSRPCRC